MHVYPTNVVVGGATAQHVPGQIIPATAANLDDDVAGNLGDGERFQEFGPERDTAGGGEQGKPVEEGDFAAGLEVRQQVPDDGFGFAVRQVTDD